MGVYIKGMEMPESCQVCVAGYWGLCFAAPPETGGVCPDSGKPDWCPLEEIDEIEIEHVGYTPEQCGRDK